MIHTIEIATQQKQYKSAYYVKLKKNKKKGSRPLCNIIQTTLNKSVIIFFYHINYKSPANIDIGL